MMPSTGCRTQARCAFPATQARGIDAREHTFTSAAIAAGRQRVSAKPYTPLPSARRAAATGRHAATNVLTRLYHLLHRP